ncbi:nicotinamidase/pyrazinamidase [Nitratiruptor sp. YY08-26]|uniref:isochorismatase family protein n=1 Tax=unclassified Nitratiruptor TaxID=2624044 RepID=UPI001916BE63|nr:MULTISPECIES: isochorismatase family protein [unclassified Nitratiruptor]BCD62443.1 nicotinamidase/pyrazinamidase [Nitratiruptor sp. YY08-13]BCD66379.1 nicotinamidase/pyrazinamidase [Nitratiruptor sp. YY08-26]
MKIKLTPKDALIVVDMQRDFMPGGALPVKDGDKIIPTINRYIQLFSNKSLPIFFTRDWHPSNHLSFETHGGRWPVHCVANSPGAAFAQDLLIPQDNKFIISKGTTEDFDAYSGFQGTILHSLLQERGRQRVFICGVATDFCVKHTALGALHLGYIAFILNDAIKGVMQEEEAKEEVIANGGILIDYNDLAK